jgi:cobalt-zinc-cadmium resistance protein CzcA
MPAVAHEFLDLLHLSRPHMIKRTIQFASSTVAFITFPIFTLQRHKGRILAPMAVTANSASIGSLLFSLTLVPLLYFYLHRKSSMDGCEV